MFKYVLACSIWLTVVSVDAQSPVWYFQQDCTPHLASQSCCWDTDSFVAYCGTGAGQFTFSGVSTLTGIATKVPYFTANGSMSTSALQVDPTTGNMGLRATPGTIGLYLYDGPGGAAASIMQETYTNSASGSSLFQRRARGSEVAPEKAQQFDIIAVHLASTWARDAANTSDAWTEVGQSRFTIDTVDAESRIGGRYEVVLSSGVSASPVVKWRLASNGSVMSGNAVTGTPTADLDILGQTFRLRTAKTPASATEACNAGTIVWDTGFVYVCTATNAWKRAALTAW